MVWVLFVLVLGAAGAWVVGGSGRATPDGGPGVRWWLAGRRLACGHGGAGCLWCWGSSFGCLGSVVVGVAPVVVEGVDVVRWWWCCCVAAVGGAGDVVGEGAAGAAPGIGAAGDADGEVVVGDALVNGGVLTVPWGWDLATPGGGSVGVAGWSVGPGGVGRAWCRGPL